MLYFLVLLVLAVLHGASAAGVAPGVGALGQLHDSDLVVIRWQPRREVAQEAFAATRRQDRGVCQQQQVQALVIDAQCGHGVSGGS